VVAATVAQADAIMSWNFQHIVRLDKMKAYNQVNQLPPSVVQFTYDYTISMALSVLARGGVVGQRHGWRNS